MRFSNSEVGKYGEDSAVKFLRGRGYKIIAKNFRSGRFGEIDIAARKNNKICFIEVKTRSCEKYGLPNEAVDYMKRKKIERVAEVFVRHNGFESESIQFDVLEVFVEKNETGIHVKNINLVENAF